MDLNYLYCSYILQIINIIDLANLSEPGLESDRKLSYKYILIAYVNDVGLWIRRQCLSYKYIFL